MVGKRGGRRDRERETGAESGEGCVTVELPSMNKAKLDAAVFLDGTSKRKTTRQDSKQKIEMRRERERESKSKNKIKQRGDESCLLYLIAQGMVSVLGDLCLIPATGNKTEPCAGAGQEKAL